MVLPAIHGSEISKKNIGHKSYLNGNGNKYIKYSGSTTVKVRENLQQRLAILN